MPGVNEVIDSLKRNDKVLLNDGVNPWQGFVVSIDDESVTINIYVLDINKTFIRNEITELSII